MATILLCEVSRFYAIVPSPRPVSWSRLGHCESRRLNRLDGANNTFVRAVLTILAIVLRYCYGNLHSLNNHFARLIGECKGNISTILLLNSSPCPHHKPQTIHMLDSQLI